MACFIVPASEAVVTEIISKVVKNREMEKDNKVSDIDVAKIPFSRKVKWLTRMLTGGSFLLAFEHVWHGEVVPYFPFLTATTTADGTAGMLYEMSTVGVAMALSITAVWIGILAVVKVKEKNYIKELNSMKVKTSKVKVK